MADAGGTQGGSSGAAGQTSGGRDSANSDAVIQEAQVAMSGKGSQMIQVISSGEEARRRRGKKKEPAEGKK